MAVPLLSVAAPARRLIGDKAYDADSLRRWLAERRIKAVIPSTASRRTPYPLNRRIYRRRNVIERLFCRLKTGAVSLPDMTDTPAITSPASHSPLPSPSGSNESPT